MKGLFFLLGLALSLACALTYWQAIYSRSIRPHLFSWLIWSITMGVAGAAQIRSNGGAASWIALLGSINCFLIAVACLWIGHKGITRSDWLLLAAALLAVPLWMITRQPLWSVLLVTGIDAIGYGPTFRKSWDRPGQESVLAFVIGGLAMLFSLLALDSYPLTNWIYPAVIVIFNGVLVGMLQARRRYLQARA